MAVDAATGIDSVTADEAADHDAWVQAKVMASLDEVGAPVRHDRVMSEAMEIIREAERSRA